MLLANTFSVGYHNIKGMHDKNVCKINDIEEELSNDVEILVET